MTEPLSGGLAGGLVGTSVRRREDERLLAGRGSFLADAAAGHLQVAFVRSSEAAATIEAIDVSAAVAMPGVLGVFGPGDLELASNEIATLHNPHPGFAAATEFAMADPHMAVLADERVTYVGQPVVAVVARDRYLAEDAVEAVVVTYGALPAVVDAERALTRDAPIVHPELTGNEAARIRVEFGAGADSVDAAVRVRGTYRMGRHGAIPLEGRGVRASLDRHRNRIEMWTSTQIPHRVRASVADCLGVEEQSIRVAVPDVGGGFGTKANVYAEEVVLAALARVTGQDVIWVEDRQENLLSAAQGRDQVHHTELAVDSHGRILHWADDFVVDVGSGSLWIGGIIANTAIHLLGPYRIPNVRIHGRAAFTNKCIVAQYRGAGRPEASFALERALDDAATRLGLSGEEIRRRNLLTAADLPYERPIPYRDGVPISYDGGDYLACLDAAVELLPRSAVAEYAERHPDLAIGYGIGTYLEATGRGPWEAGRITLLTGGEFHAAAGAASAGQAHETSFAQVAAEALDVPMDRVRYSRADTDHVVHGVGTFASRSAVLAGSALHRAGKELVRRGRERAAELLGAAVEDVDYVAGSFKSGNGALDWSEIAAATAPGGRLEGAPELDVTDIFRPRTVTWTMGVHAAVVGVQRASGMVRVLDYAVAHEGGLEINPQVVAGQIAGGVAQGIGGALLEEFAYAEGGQPLSTTFLSYLVPGAGEVPPVRIAHLPVATLDNPIGVRGAGESGTIAAYATIAAAIDDAVGPGLHLDRTPISSATVRRALLAATDPATIGVEQ
ncbi:MAG: xanthine dehydrogenase family protein molybdopterin-binding subunit [Propionibacteriaceae bacterium]